MIDNNLVRITYQKAVFPAINFTFFFRKQIRNGEALIKGEQGSTIQDNIQRESSQ